MVLGVAQDAGHPQAGCVRPCCARALKDPSLGHRVVSLGLVDPGAGRWLIDASPDLARQLAMLGGPPDGILITHAHIGHITGLLQLGREGMGARGLTVWALPRMARFLAQAPPWEQLVRLGNIRLAPLRVGEQVALSERLRVTPVAVPHRDEYSETAGFMVAGPRRRVLWVPDVDHWSGWDADGWIRRADVAWLDGTFFDASEVSGRDRAEIPHPMIADSLVRFGGLARAGETLERGRIRFIHLNHSNPALDPGSDAAAKIRAAGMSVAVEGEVERL